MTALLKPLMRRIDFGTPLKDTASLSLDFARQQYFAQGIGDTFGDIITFTRASQGGRFNALGQYELVPANVPRLTHDPVTLQPLGLLVEEQRTNLLTNSGNAGLWPKNTANLSAVITGTPAPVAGVGAVWWDVSDTGSGDDFFSAVLSVANDSSPCTATIFVEKTANALNAVGLGVFFSGGTTPVAGFATLNTNNGEVRTASTVVSAAVEDLGTCWRLILSVANNGTGNTSCNWRFYPAYKLNATAGSTRDNAVTGSARVVGRGLEVGATPSSYIPTEASQVTRAADMCSVLTLSPWYNASEGTIVVKAISSPSQSAPVSEAYAALRGASINDRIEIAKATAQTNITGEAVVGGVGQANMNGATMPPNTGFSAAMSYKANDFAFSLNGGAVATDNSGSVPVVTLLQIGSRSSANQCNGIISSITYYPRKLANSELQAITV